MSVGNLKKTNKFNINIIMAVVTIFGLQNVHTAEKLTGGHLESEAVSALKFEPSVSWLWLGLKVLIRNHPC